jgi:hypothetical protein
MDRFTDETARTVIRHPHYLLGHAIGFLFERIAGLADRQLRPQRRAEEFVLLTVITFTAQAGRSAARAFPLQHAWHGSGDAPRLKILLGSLSGRGRRHCSTRFATVGLASAL